MENAWQQYEELSYAAVWENLETTLLEVSGFHSQGFAFKHL